MNEKSELVWTKKSERTKTMTVRFDNDVYEKISEIARYSEIKRTDVIRRLVEFGLKNSVYDNTDDADKK